jgi:transposase-like protein
MYISDPTAIKALLEPDLPLHQVSGSLAWVTFLMTLFYWNVPLSVLGRWVGVHKTTILRWIVGLALALWPTIYRWILERVKARMVYIDEKWIKLRGRWRYWYVVLDVQTELPILAALLPSRTKWACRWIGCLLKRINKTPAVIITDGLQAYESLLPGIKHVLCRFHHQQGVIHWLKKHFATEQEIEQRKPVMKKLFQTTDKRTVRRRLARLMEQAPIWGIPAWVTTVMEKLPSLICSIGSVRLPATTNALERFFRAFNRFYKTRGGFHSVLSAKRELILFLVVYLFTQRRTDGHAPIEGIMPVCRSTGRPEARHTPLYRLINDPLRALQELGNVKEKDTMADFLLPNLAAA